MRTSQDAVIQFLAHYDAGLYTAAELPFALIEVLGDVADPEAGWAVLPSEWAGRVGELVATLSEDESLNDWMWIGKDDPSDWLQRGLRLKRWLTATNLKGLRRAKEPNLPCLNRWIRSAGQKTAARCPTHAVSARESESINGGVILDADSELRVGQLMVWRNGCTETTVLEVRSGQTLYLDTRSVTDESELEVVFNRFLEELTHP